MLACRAAAADDEDVVVGVQEGDVQEGDVITLSMMIEDDEPAS